MRNLLTGAMLALALVACTAAATVYVSQEDHDADVHALQVQIDELEYRLYTVESVTFGPPLSGPLYTFDNGAPR